MFEDGSPKDSHKVVVAIGVLAGLVMTVASHWARVSFRAGGRSVELEIGALWAMGMGIIIVVLLLAWHRGWLAGTWPLTASLIAAVLAFLLLLGDWSQGRAQETDVHISTALYVTLAASLVAAVACAVALLRPVVEHSEGRGQWISRRTFRDSPPGEGR